MTISILDLQEAVESAATASLEPLRHLGVVLPFARVLIRGSSLGIDFPMFAHTEYELAVARQMLKNFVRLLPVEAILFISEASAVDKSHLDDILSVACFHESTSNGLHCVALTDDVDSLGGVTCLSVLGVSRGKSVTYALPYHYNSSGLTIGEPVIDQTVHFKYLEEDYLMTQ